MGNSLERIRKSRGLTREALADKIGTSKGQIYKLERGERRLTDTWLRRLGQALEVAPGAILTEYASKEEQDLEARAETEFEYIRHLERKLAATDIVETDKFLDIQPDAPRAPSELVEERSPEFLESEDNFYAVLVKGAGMDMFLPDGSIVFVARLEHHLAAGRGVRDGMLVIVERSRGNALSRELRQIVMEEPGNFSMVARSLRAPYQPISYQMQGRFDMGIDRNKPEDTVRIVAVVLATVGKHI